LRPVQRRMAEIPIVKAGMAQSPTEKLVAVLAILQQRGRVQAAVKTLASTINSLVQKSVSDEELYCMLQSLQQQGFIFLIGTKMS